MEDKMEKKNYTLAGAIIGIVFKLYFIIQLLSMLITFIKTIKEIDSTKKSEIITIVILATISIIAFTASLICDCLIIGKNNKKFYLDNAIIIEIIAACLMLVCYIIMTIITDNLSLLDLDASLELLMTIYNLPNIIALFATLALIFCFYMIGYKTAKTTTQEQDKNTQEQNKNTQE